MYWKQDKCKYLSDFYKGQIVKARSRIPPKRHLPENGPRKEKQWTGDRVGSNTNKDLLKQKLLKKVHAG